MEQYQFPYRRSGHILNFYRGFAVLVALVFLCQATCGQVVDTIAAPPLSKNWTLFLNALPPASFATLPESLLSSKRECIKPRIVSFPSGTIDLAALVAGKFSEKSPAMLYNKYFCAKAARVRLGIAADYWLEVYSNGEKVFSTFPEGNQNTTYSPNDHVFEFPAKAGENLLAVRIVSGSRGWRFVCGKATRPPDPPKTSSASMANLTFTANAEWHSVDMNDVKVKPGSALDLSGVSAVPMPLRRLVVNGSGKLAAQGEEHIPLRLQGFNFSARPFFQLKDYYKMMGEKTLPGPEDNITQSKEKIAEFCRLAKLQGYNLLRLNAVDFLSPQADMDIRPEYLERMDYLLYQMRTQGLYLHLTMAAYIFYLKEPKGHLFNDKKARMYLGDTQMRAAWKYGVETLMNHVNPYTGLAWKDDPVIADIEFFNEQEFGFMAIDKITPETRRSFDAKFRLWLERKYKMPEILAQAWWDNSLKSFGQTSVPTRFDAGMGPDANDFLLFCNDLSRENGQWCEKTLRACGYAGLCSQYNLPYGFGGLEARFEVSQVSIDNTYFSHPSGKGSSESPWGTNCIQRSSLVDAAMHWRASAARRFTDRPFFVTEYNHAFWNKYQHEGGLVFAAYSAFQGFDAIIIHADAVISSVDAPNNPFSAGRSPLCRANEFLSSCLFLRGDVKSSSRLIELAISKEYLDADCHSAKSVSQEQNRLALMMGFAINFPGATRPAGIAANSKALISLFPDSGAVLKVQAWFTETVETKGEKFPLDAFIGTMKTKGLLPKSNCSEPEKGIFQSDSGEILLRSRENLMSVTTAKTEAVSLEAGKSETLNKLIVARTSVPALVASCSIDGRTLATSNRIVLLYSTEIVNSGMEVSGDRVKLLKLGHLPVLMKTGTLKATLENVNGRNMALFALGFNGVRRERIPVTFSNGKIEIFIDTSILKDGPTPFFELVAGVPGK